jgi:suppressor of ftsI
VWVVRRRAVQWGVGTPETTTEITGMRHALPFALLLAGSPLFGQDAPRCAWDASPFATPYCAELVATPDLPGVKGMLELRWVPTPFGVAVRPDGQLRHRLVARLRGLPAPSTLGGRVFVAWGYDLTHRSEVHLGVVTNGSTSLGELPFEYFRVIVSAESSATVSTRRGRLVARATSPNSLMLSHRDAVAPLLVPSSASADHSHHGAGAEVWPMPPNDPRIAPAAMQHTPPTTAAWRPDSTGREVVPHRAREVVRLRHNDTLQLTAGLVRRTIGGRTMLMYGYNGQSPGPLIEVDKGTELVVNFTNRLDMPTTVHWHGLRLENRSDGVPGHPTPAVEAGGSFTYRLRFPDAGIYWYHPHVREDIQQDLGLYGNISVGDRANAPGRQEVLALDDLQLDDRGQLMPWGADTASHALMGRFGNLLLVNGEPAWRLNATQGEVVRFALTNVANARTFNLRLPGARIKLVASDVSAFEREAWVESIVLAPAERYVVDVRFDSAGVIPLVNSVRWLDHMRGTTAPAEDTLGTVIVSPAPHSKHAGFERLGERRDVQREIAAAVARAPRLPQHTLTLGMRLKDVTPQTVAMLTGIAMPMDWNDAMPMMNWALSAREVAWTLRDDAGRENMQIGWRFKTGEVSRIRLVSDPGATHAMAHPIHFHGQRFVVMSRNGVPVPNRAWKDTALLPAGETMEILLELTNPGTWMMHCHVAEHLGTGMMGMFVVEGRDRVP